MAKKCCSMMEISGNRIGLALGGTFAIIHIIWVIMVKIGVAAKFMDWILGLHFVNIPYGMYTFSIGNAIFLVIMTFLAGYIIGWLFALLYHCVGHKLQ